MTRFLIAFALTLALAAPAMAGGLTLNIQANNRDDANAIRAGLVFYKVVKDIKAHGHISQRGARNVASLAQGGRGNIGIIHQDGLGHRASVKQTGNRNSCGVFQFGNSRSAHVTQTGGGACIIVQAGF